jgi:Ulp1 family protease
MSSTIRSKLLIFFGYLRDISVPVDLPCPQQANGRDCGVYCVLFAERISRLVLPLHTTTQEAIAALPRLIVEAVASVKPVDADQYRQQCLGHIEELMRER